MTHRNAPLTPEGRKRLIERCRTRPIAHVAAEMGISRATASKWVNRYRKFGGVGLLDRSSVPLRQPTAISGDIVARIEQLRRERKWSASRIAFELFANGTTVSRRTITRHLAQLGLNRRRFIDPNGENNREVKTITAKHPGHMVHLDVKKAGRIPDGGGWRVHGKNSPEARAVARTKTRGTRAGYAFLHSAIDGHTRLAYTESLENEQAATAVAFLTRAREWFAKHGIVKIERIINDNGSCYRSHAFTAALKGAEHRRTRPYTPKHNGKVERYNRILRRRVPLCQDMDFRAAARESTEDLEPALQLPPTPRRARRQATRIRHPATRQQRAGLIQLGGPLAGRRRRLAPCSRRTG